MRVSPTLPVPRLPGSSPAIAAVHSLATAVPRRYATGAEVFSFFDAHFGLKAETRELYRRLLLNGPIRGRYIAIDRDEEICDQRADDLHRRFLCHARQLAAAAARQALDRADLTPADLAGIVVNTCTGYTCPGLSSYLADDLNVPEATRTMDLVGMGCGGALPNLQAAAGLLATMPRPPARPQRPPKAVLSVAVEVCSATIFLGSEPDLVVSNSIFGDGAAAAVLADPAQGPSAAGQSSGKPLPAMELLDFESLVLPACREDLRYRFVDGRLRNVLSRRVPVIAGRACRTLAQRLLARHGLDPDHVARWIVHPGGARVLDAVERELALPSGAIDASRAILRDYGNMSSPAVLFVLDHVLRTAPPPSGSLMMLLAFGAGFTGFAALARVS